MGYSVTNTNEMRKAALSVMSTLTKAGFVSYMVGGCVRDTLLGKEPKDFDVTTNATPDQVAALFNNSAFVGAHFGVSLVKFEDADVEVATFRRDGEYSDNRRPDSVELTLDVREDVTRRDFTVNALLMDENGNVVDHVNGLVDLNNRVLRCVGNPDDRFNEDSLRMLRAVRFCAMHEFVLESDTFNAIVRNAHLVKNVSAERVAGELSKMLVSGHADVAFDLLLETGLAKFVMPELCDFVGCEHNSSFHPEGDVANHVRLLLAGLEKGCSLTLALAVLLHDVAKPRTRGVTKEGKTHFRGHENVGADMAKDILHRLKFSNDVTDVVVNHVKNHMKFFVARQMKRSTLMRFLRLPNFAELLALGKLDVGASNKDFSDVEFVERFLKEHGDELTRERFVNGDDLIAMGFVPGPNFKVLLEQVETEQFENRLTTREAALNFVRARSPRREKRK
jgi:poly(A) polymerase